eukprot:1506617-Amphidinium_carterae.1
MFGEGRLIEQLDKGSALLLTPAELLGPSRASAARGDPDCVHMQDASFLKVLLHHEPTRLNSTLFLTTN